MKVGFLVPHSCIGTHKLAAGLAEHGHEVFLICEQFSPNHPWWQYKHVSRTFRIRAKGIDDQIPIHLWKNSVDLIDSIVDLYHVQCNDWLLPEVKSWTKKPVVYGVHDLRSHNDEKDYPEEDRSFEVCDGVTTCSKKMWENIERKSGKNPFIIYHSAPNSWIPREFVDPSRFGLVYAGAIGGDLPYRQWGGYFCQLEDLGVSVTALAASKGETLTLPRPLKTTQILKAMPYQAMVSYMSSFTASLVGFPEKCPAGDVAVPNKFWDSMAAGVPVIATNIPEVEDLVEKYDVGEIVRGPEEIPLALHRLRKDTMMRLRCRALAHKFSMSVQVPEIVRYYKSVVGETS